MSCAEFQPLLPHSTCPAKPSLSAALPLGSGAIRQAKTYRQIILVSNNGNVVVNSDAEQIVIANREFEKISYVAEPLENSVIRERALKVLEGGAEAFRKRQQKYRIISK